MIDPILV
jgi:hypothetical protein